MIAPMKRVAIVCLSADAATTVELLRDLGVVHLTPTRPAHGVEIDVARRRIERLRGAASALAPGSGASDLAGVPGDVEAAAESIHHAIAALRDLSAEVIALEAERRILLPYGHFELEDARALLASGLTVRLLQFPAADEPPVVPPDSALMVVGESEGVAHAVLIGPPGATCSARELPWPERSLRDIEGALADNAERRIAAERQLASFASLRPVFERRAQAVEDDLRLLEARAGMGSDGDLAWLLGFCPTDRIAELTAASSRGGFAITARDPLTDEVVPTLLRGGAFVRQVHAVLEMIGISPGYGEPDVSPAFLVFLVLFAGMLIGDAGYGVLLLIAAFVASRRAGGNPPQAVRLLRTIGVATLAWGALTGTWFAIPHLPAVLDGLRVEWLAGADRLATTRHVMLLCFFIGAIHITLAHLWAAVRSRRSVTALAQMGWIASTWCMFFVARTMVLGDPFPPILVPITVGGIAAIVLFMTPVKSLRSEWFNHVMLPLSLVSNFVDVVSYLRLFAVGSAGVAVASAFNQMAARIGADGGFNILTAALVAVFGHTLNLLLCAMGVLVHGVRLNTLEFSAHLGMQWSGVRYEPLRRRVGHPESTTDRPTN